MSSCGCTTGLDEAIAAAKAASKNDRKIINIDLMYIDLSVCSRCQDTDESLDQAIAHVQGVLKMSGYEVFLTKILVESEEQARALKFVTSPTIRINGEDIQLEAKESHCSSCSTLVDDQPVDCRTWEYQGESYDAPPTEMIVEAILRHVFGSNDATGDAPKADYEVPENLKRFFAAKGEKPATAGDCTTGSCGCA